MYLAESCYADIMVIWEAELARTSDHIDTKQHLSTASRDLPPASQLSR